MSDAKYNLPGNISDLSIDGYTIDLTAGVTNGQILQYNGTAFIAATGSGTGTVTSVATDSTLTGGTITNSGTLGINLAHSNLWTADQTFTHNVLIDGYLQLDGYTIDLKQGAISGQVLQYNGTNFVAATSAGSGTVTSIATDSTLTGGTITTTGTLGINLSHSNLWTADQTFTHNVLIDGYLQIDGYTIDLSHGAVSGMILQYDGNHFIPTTPADGGAVSSVSNNDSTLTISPTTGGVIAGLNLSHSNLWTADQTFTHNVLIDGYLQLDGYTIDLRHGAVPGMVLRYDGNHFIPATDDIPIRDGDIDDYPVTVGTINNEFNSSMGSWTQYGTINASAIDPYAGFSSGGMRTSLNSYRKGWFMMQPDATNSTYGISCPTGVMPANVFYYAKLCFNTRTIAAINNDFNIGLWLTPTTGSQPDATSGVQMYLNESDAGVSQCQFDLIGGSSFLTTNMNATTMSIQAIQYVGIQKIGTVYHGWVGTKHNWIYMGNVTTGTTLDRISVNVSNNDTTAPGCMIMGVDFVREIDSATFLP